MKQTNHTNYIKISVAASALVFGLSGCTSTSTQQLNQPNIYEKGDKVIAKNTIERYFNINIGDTAKTIFERLSLLDGNVYIVDNSVFRSSFAAPGLKTFEDVEKFFQANNIALIKNEIQNSKYVKIGFSNTGLSEIEKKLSQIKVSASGSMPIASFAQDISAKAGIPVLYADKTAKNLSTITKNISIDTDGLSAIKQIANSADLDAKITQSNIELSYFKTDTLNIDIFSRDRSILNKIANNTASSGNTKDKQNTVSDNSGNKDLEIKYLTGLVKELESSVESLLSEHGSFKLLQSSGQIVVRDKSENVKSIQKIINDFNAQFKDTVELTLTFYKVTTQKGDKRGLDFRALNGKLAATATGMTNLTGLSSSAGSITSAFGLEYTGSGGRSALFNLLSEFGTTEVMNPVEIVTQSNMLKTVKIANNFGYIASIDTTTSTNTGTTASIEPSSVPDGMFFSLLAKPIDNNHIAVDIYATNNSFVKFNTATAFGSTVQTPDTSEQSVDGYHQLKNGVPQILVSHKYEESKLDEAGLPVKFLKSIGYKEDSSKDTYIVIALEANVR